MAYIPTGKPTGRPPGGKYTPRKIESIQEMSRALELRKAGLTLREIGERMGFHPSNIQRKIRRGLKYTIEQSVEEARGVESERLEKQYAKLLLRLHKAEQEDDHDKICDIHRLLLSIHNAIAKIQGLHETKISLRAEIHNRERMDVIAVAILKNDDRNAEYHALLGSCIRDAGFPGGYGVGRNGEQLPAPEAHPVVELSPDESGGWSSQTVDRDDAAWTREIDDDVEDLPGVVPREVPPEEGGDRQP